MTINGLLPIGSVVLLKNSTKRVMIIGVCQISKKEDGTQKFFDYSGCVFPEGYLGPDKTFLFNNDQIDQLFAIGYQDAEALAFKEKADEICARYQDKQ